MKKITLHLITRTKCYSMYEQGQSWSLSPWGGNTAYYEGTSTPFEFECPDNLEIVKTLHGVEMFCWKGEKYCTELNTNSHQQPYVFTSSGRAVTLKRA